MRVRLRAWERPGGLRSGWAKILGLPWAAAPSMAQGEHRTVSSMAELLLEKAVEDAKRKKRG